MLRRRRSALRLRAAVRHAVGIPRPSVRHCEQSACSQFMVQKVERDALFVKRELASGPRSWM